MTIAKNKLNKANHGAKINILGAECSSVHTETY